MPFLHISMAVKVFLASPWYMLCVGNTATAVLLMFPGKVSGSPPPTSPVISYSHADFLEIHGWHNTMSSYAWKPLIIGSGRQGKEPFFRSSSLLQSGCSRLCWKWKAQRSEYPHSRKIPPCTGDRDGAAVLPGARTKVDEKPMKTFEFTEKTWWSRSIIRIKEDLAEIRAIKGNKAK